MEDCSICYNPGKSWKVLPCQHRLCKKCYIQLRQNCCPYCRNKFNYSYEDEKKRIALKIIQDTRNPPTQSRYNNTNINNISYNFNQRFSRIERNRHRRRRKKLTFKEIQEKRRLIKKKCKLKWLKKNRNRYKNNWWNLEIN